MTGLAIYADCLKFNDNRWNRLTVTLQTNKHVGPKTSRWLSLGNIENISINLLVREPELAVARDGVHDEVRVDTEDDAYQHETAAAAEHHRTPRLIQPDTVWTAQVKNIEN